ncbi:ABC transporter ATP-binding protein [Desulfogranum marinum]|uniref:ABC transporter ATP-binding protein n=1 Tax=Desulfogranum marinum TaxID=453220 RepID=UPI001966734D|nr:ABC transporter ATP-binding protein [Desulfogranum marinum]MBM9514880.1 ABC transporter ATP-binding protein [Desulfogranum marinum]
MPSSYIYKLRDVEKRLEKGGVSFTLCIPELTIHPGEFWSIVGPSGCGKSTLLDLLALVLSPTSVSRFEFNVPMYKKTAPRRITDFSENDAAKIRRKHIGYILQNGGLLPFLSVQDNILLTAQISKSSITTTDYNTLINALGLPGQLKKKPQFLSGGQRQRVAIARALIHRPSIILADEPTAAVDSQTAADIMTELRSLSRKFGSAVMMVTHDRNLVDSTSDQTIEFNITRNSIDNTVASTSISNQVNK